MRRLHLVLIITLMFTGCAGPRLSSSEARQKVAEIASSTFVPDAIEIRRIVSQTDDQAIAETTVTLAFQFKKDPGTGEWQVEAVRLGDREWVDMAELMAAVTESRVRETTTGLQKLVDGIQAYRLAMTGLPQAADIVTLTDILHPTYMADLVRIDAWGRPIEYQASESTFRLTSSGPDSVLGTPDDIVLTGPPQTGPVL